MCPSPPSPSRPRRALSSVLIPMLSLLAACSGRDATPSNPHDAGIDLVAISDLSADQGDFVLPDQRSDLDVSGDDSPDSPPSEPSVPEGCNPAAYELHCMFPYPSDVFLQPNEALPSGHEVVLPEAAQLKTKRGALVNFLVHHRADGFSHHQPIVAVFGVPIDEANLTFHTDDPEETLATTSTTLILNASTGEPVAHWAEMDRFSKDPSQRTLQLRLLKNLEHETRYVVAIQGLKSPEGELIQAPQGFKQLRDREPELIQGLSAHAERYDQEIFAPLEAFGLERGSLQLAWDFTTQSEAMVTRDLVTMRDDLMRRFEEAPPAVTITAMQRDPNEQIALRLEGTITVPLYLEEDASFTTLHRDSAGDVSANGTHQVPFLLQVPRSAIPEAAGFAPARLVQYGHGFFGLREEIDYSFMRAYSDQARLITASVDWRGMTQEEGIGLVGKLLGDTEGALKFVSDTHQGIIDFIALSEALQTTLAELPELNPFGEPLYKKERLYYYGISQGQILGAAFLSLSPHIERAVLSVGGAPFSFMMSRSANFEAFLNLLRSSLPDNLAVQQFITLCQHSFDRIDPSTYSPHLLTGRLHSERDETMPILMQLGYWDHSVPTLSGLIYARNAGFEVLEPTPELPYGLSSTSAPAESAVTLVDFNVQDPPGFYAQPPTAAQLREVEEGTNVHESVRRLEPVQAQIDAFLRPDGQIIHPCDGPCDPD